MTKPSTIWRTTDLLHPVFRPSIEMLLDRIAEVHSPFRLFETYRSPIRQGELRAQQPPVTKAGPWHSPHQYGLAADFVTWANGHWDWDVNEQEYRLLHSLAEGLNVHFPLKWDPGHCELKDWERITTI